MAAAPLPTSRSFCRASRLPAALRTAEQSLSRAEARRRRCHRRETPRKSPDSARFPTLQVGTPKAGLLVYCGGMAIAVGDKLGEGLSGPLVGKAAGVPPG